MFQVSEDLSINITRGDTAVFSVVADNTEEAKKFQPDDVVRFTVYAKKNCEDVVLQKDVEVLEETDRVDFILTENDTKIGNVISKPVEYWYEVELNPFTNPQTIIGYDDDGAKVFKLFPEGADVIDVEEEDIPVIDNDFSAVSERPVANYVITKKISELESKIKSTEEKITSKDIVPITSAEMEELLRLGTWKKNTVYLITDEEDITEEEKNDALEVANEALEVAKEAKSRADKSATTKTHVISTANSDWSEDAVNGGYVCEISVSGILATDTPIVDVVLGEDIDANKLYLASWAKITRIVTGDDTITLYANDELPETEFTMQIKVVR